MTIQRFVDWLRPPKRKRKRTVAAPYIATCGWCDVTLPEPAASQGRYTYTGHQGGRIHLCDDCAAHLGFCLSCKRASCMHTRGAKR